MLNTFNILSRLQNNFEAPSNMSGEEHVSLGNMTEKICNPLLWIPMFERLEIKWLQMKRLGKNSQDTNKT